MHESQPCGRNRPGWDHYETRPAVHEDLAHPECQHVHMEYILQDRFLGWRCDGRGVRVQLSPAGPARRYCGCSPRTDRPPGRWNLQEFLEIPDPGWFNLRGWGGFALLGGHCRLLVDKNRIRGHFRHLLG